MIGWRRDVMRESLTTINLPTYWRCFRGLVDPSFFFFFNLGKNLPEIHHMNILFTRSRCFFGGDYLGLNMLRGSR